MAKQNSIDDFYKRLGNYKCDNQLRFEDKSGEIKIVEEPKDKKKHVISKENTLSRFI